MANFNDYLAALKTDLESFAETSFTIVRDAAIKDGTNFIQRSTANLQRWTGLLASEQLTRDDLNWLVTSQKDLIEMEALEQAGLEQAALDRFSDGLIALILTTAIKIFVP